MKSKETIPIKILIVVAFDLFRKGLAQLVNGQSDFIVVGEVSTGLEAVQLNRNSQFEVVLMDTSIKPDITRILKLESSVRVLALDLGGTPAEISEFLMAGADGFLLTTATPEHLFKSIRQVAKQETLTNKLIPAGSPIEVILTPRERKVIAELTQGATTIEIASTYDISQIVVQTTINNLKDKLGVANRAQIVERAFVLGLYTPKLD